LKVNKKLSLIFSVLFTLALFILYFISNNLDKENLTDVNLGYALDGDTIKTLDGKTLRLANINAPEKGEQGYDEAGSFLNTYFNKTVQVVFLGKDKYGRELVKIYSPDYINLKIVKEGHASKFLVSDKEVRIFSKAEKEAIENERGMWKLSPFYNCIKGKINPKEEYVMLTYICEGNMPEGLWIKDESRSKFNLPPAKNKKLKIISGKGDNKIDIVYWNGEAHIWNDDRDTLYVFDSDAKLVYYKSYGYYGYG